MPRTGVKLRTMKQVLTSTKTKAENRAESAAQTAGHRRMKKEIGGAGVQSVMGAAGRSGELAMLQKLSETDDARGERCRVPLEVEKAAIVAYASGMTPGEIHAQYDVNVQYVKFALARRFGSSDAAKRALQGLILENAIACQVHGAMKLPEMNAPQAFMSGAILVDKAIALEKSMEGSGKTIDFGQLSEIGRTLKILREIKIEGEAKQVEKGKIEETV